MSFLDLDRLSPEELILHYVLECRGQGHFLPYLDYQVIEEWLAASLSPDELLLVLSEVLPDYFRQEQGARPVAKPLSGVRRLVLRRLRDLRMRDRDPDKARRGSVQ